MEFTRPQRYADKLSISANIGKKNTFTYKFSLEDFNFDNPPEELHKCGFTPMVYEDGHRCKDSFVGLTSVGYFDIDLGEGEPFKYEDFQPLIDERYALVIAQSKSRAVGKYRVIYKRPYTIENNMLLSNDIGVILYRFENVTEAILFAEYALKHEINTLIKRIPSVASHIDKTACKVHMHSSFIGDVLFYTDGKNFLESIDIDIDDFKAYRAQNYRLFETCSVEMLGVSERGIKTHFKTEKRDNTLVHRAYGNIFETARGSMTISQILSMGIRPQMCDVMENRITTPDAFMPFVVKTYSKTIILTSRGIHDRNKNELIRVVFNRGAVDKTVEMTIDTKRYLIDEINLSYKEVK